MSIFKPVTKWAERVTDTRRIPELISKAIRMATQGQQGPVYLDLPGDILYNQVELDGVHFPRNLPKQPRPSGDPELIEEALALLNQAKRAPHPDRQRHSVVRCLRRTPGLRRTDRHSLLHHPQGRGVIPEDHPLSFLGARSKAFKEADVVLVVGTRLNFVVGFGLPPRWAEDAKIIQVDIHREEVGRNRTIDVGIVGDARRVLEQLTAAARTAFPRPIDLPWIDALRQSSRQNEEKAEALLNTDAMPIHPLRLCKEVRDFMDRDAILVVDGHEILNYARQSIPPTRQATASMPGANGCMGVAIPYGLGAKMAKPEKQVIVLSGDGSFGMNGMEMDTAVWHHIPILVVVSNNGGWAAMGGMAAVTLVLPATTNSPRYWGATVSTLRNPMRFARLWSAPTLLCRPGTPAVVNVITDPRARSQTVRFSAYRAI